MLDDAPGELQIGHLGFRGLNLRHAHAGIEGQRLEVLVLDQQAAGDGDILLAHDAVLLHVDLQQAQVLLRAKDLQRLGREGRGHDDLQEDGLHQGRGRSIDLAVGGHDAAEDADLVGLIGLGPGIHDITADRRAAGIHVLESHAERHAAELAHDAQGRVGILDVVVGQFLAVQLDGARQREGPRLRRGIELRLLMGILAVAQALLELVFEEEFLVQAGLGAHIGRDHHIVLGRVRIGLGRKFEPCFG